MKSELQEKLQERLSKAQREHVKAIEMLQIAEMQYRKACMQVLSENVYSIDDEWTEEENKKVTSPDDAWLMKDSDYEKYLKLVGAKYRIWNSEHVDGDTLWQEAERVKKAEDELLAIAYILNSHNDTFISAWPVMKTKLDVRNKMIQLIKQLDASTIEV